MIPENTWSRLLSGLLTLCDATVAIIAFFGGMNLFNVNVPAAVGTLFCGVTVLVLSFGLWNGNRMLQIARMVLYLSGFVVTSIALAAVGLTKGISVVWPLPIVVALFFIVSTISFLRLRIEERTKA